MSEHGNNRRQFKLSITAILVAGFGGLMLVAGAGQFYMGFDAARDNTRELLRDKAQAFIDGMVTNIETSLSPIVAQGRTIARLVADGELNLDDESFDSFVFGALAATPQVEQITILFPDHLARRYQRDPLSIDVVDLTDSAEAAYLADPYSGSRDPVWGEPHASQGETVISLRTPLFDAAGKFKGVLIHSISVSTLSKVAYRVARSDERQTPFILYGRSGVMAHPLLIKGNLNLSRGGELLPKAEDLGDGILASFWNKDKIELVNIAALPGGNIKGINFGGRAYLFIYKTMEGYGPLPWTVGTYFEGRHTQQQVRRLVKAAIGGVAILVLVLIGVGVIGLRAARPVKRLARAARAIQDGDLDMAGRLPSSFIREMDQASSSFNEMVEGLRERKVIRDLFGKFVPEKVAAEILHSPQGLEPRSYEATVLFVDLAGFTALAEGMEPADIIHVLNAYFTELVSIIEEKGGVITQFQGDAILAIFNVPRPLPDHARRAVEAARSIQRAVSRKKFLGHKLSCRVGVNTGPVVAGNVGASGRMNYTVHGDAVNLAARLEQLNKDHGTTILVSESTAQMAGVRQLRKIGPVSVRGRAAPVTVYTL